MLQGKRERLWSVKTSRYDNQRRRKRAESERKGQGHAHFGLRALLFSQDADRRAKVV